MARARRSLFGGLGPLPWLFALVFGAASVALVALLSYAVRQQWVLRVALSAGADGAKEGRRRFEGKVSATGPALASPSGATGAGYYAEIGRYEGSRKSRTYVTVCARTELEGVALAQEDGARRPFVDLLGQGPLSLLGRESSPSFGDPTPRLLAPLAGEGPPPAKMLELCGMSSGGEGLVYGEHVFREGEQVEAIACGRGARVEPCHDGYDIVTTVPLASMDEDGGLGMGLLALFVAGWVTISLGSAGFAVARRIPRVSRKAGEP